MYLHCIYILPCHSLRVNIVDTECHKRETLPRTASRRNHSVAVFDDLSSGREDNLAAVRGAMTHEENAMALADSLHQNNFPAFVSRRGTDHFYRVVVGPYSDVDSALRVKEQLKKAGFDAFRTPWNPSAQ